MTPPRKTKLPERPGSLIPLKKNKTKETMKLNPKKLCILSAFPKFFFSKTSKPPKQFPTFFHLVSAPENPVA